MNNKEYFFGEKLRNLRLENNMTQEQVAQLVEVDPKYISQIENGKNNCTLKLLIKFCNFYQVTPNDILVDLLKPNCFNTDIDNLNYFYSRLNKRDRKIVLEILKSFTEN